MPFKLGRTAELEPDVIVELRAKLGVGRPVLLPRGQ
jgi:hypothetical protein